MLVLDIVLIFPSILQMLFVVYLSIRIVFLSVITHSKVLLFLRILLQIFCNIHIILVSILLLSVLLVLLNSLSSLFFLDLVLIYLFHLHVLKILYFVLPIYI